MLCNLPTILLSESFPTLGKKTLWLAANKNGGRWRNSFPLWDAARMLSYIRAIGIGGLGKATKFRRATKVCFILSVGLGVCGQVM